jgi:CheY-like chemotaxis protein
VKVLILDDDKAFVRMLRLVLGEAGHEVTTATDGAAGLDVARQWDPDVIVLDLRMPGVDGETFAQRYRSLPGPRAPIVVVSGVKDARTRIDDAAAYLPKPFELDDLIGVLSLVGAQARPAVPPKDHLQPS